MGDPREDGASQTGHPGTLSARSRRPSIKCTVTVIAGLVRGGKHQMHVVGRQAVGPDFDAATFDLFGQQIAVHVLIAVLEEDRLAPIAPLRHMVRDARNNDPGQTGHDAIIHRPERIGNMYCVALFMSVFGCPWPGAVHAALNMAPSIPTCRQAPVALARCGLLSCC